MQDVDCLDTSLCCFDGCVNVCQGRGARPDVQKPEDLNNVISKDKSNGGNKRPNNEERVSSEVLESGYPAVGGGLLFPLVSRESATQDQGSQNSPTTYKGGKIQQMYSILLTITKI